MGAAPDVTGYPQRCFNAQNFWHLGWYEDRSIDIDPVTPTLLKIAAFVDYNKTSSSEYVGVKVRDLYIHYNRATAFNKDTGEKENMLTVVRVESRGTDLIASLDERSSIRRIALDDGLLSIEVCNIVSGTISSPDSMIVSIGFGDSQCPRQTGDCPGFGLLNCAPQLTQPPTRAPITQSPTRTPVTQPPTPTPTLAPTTAMPSIRPASTILFTKRTPPPNARPVGTFANIFGKAPTARPSTETPSAPSPSVPSTPSTPSGSAPDVAPAPTQAPSLTPVAPPQLSVSSAQSGQSSSDQRARRTRLSFIVLATAMVVAVLILLGCCIRNRCASKKYQDVTVLDEDDVAGFDEDELSQSSKDIAETDSSISSESSPSPSVEELIETGVVARPIGTRAGDAWKWPSASRKPQRVSPASRNKSTHPVTPASIDPEDFLGGGSLRVIGFVDESPGGSRSRNMSPVSPFLSDHALTRSYYQLSSAPKHSSESTSHYLDKSLHEENGTDRNSRMIGYSSRNSEPHTTDLRRSMASPQRAVRPHRNSPAVSSLYHDERVQRNIENPALEPVATRLQQTRAQRSMASPQRTVRPHRTSPAVSSNYYDQREERNIEPPALGPVETRLHQTTAQMNDFDPYGESGDSAAGGRRMD
jgi:hypothetical protein